MDKLQATIDAICDYDSKKLIIAHTPEAIREQYIDLTCPKSAALEIQSAMSDPQTADAFLLAGFEKLEVMRARYREAEIFVLWFEPMWLSLTDESRKLLLTYKHGVDESAFQYSRRQIFRLRSRDLEKLSKLLFVG